MKNFVQIGAKKVFDKVKLWFLSCANIYWETFLFKNEKEWISGYKSKKEVVDQILLMSGIGNDHSSLVRTEYEDEDTWGTHTCSYFDKVATFLNKNNLFTVKAVFEMDKKQSAINDIIDCREKKRK